VETLPDVAAPDAEAPLFRRCPTSSTACRQHSAVVLLLKGTDEPRGGRQSDFLDRRRSEAEAHRAYRKLRAALEGLPEARPMNCDQVSG
jgi:hypothetical protein